MTFATIHATLCYNTAERSPKRGKMTMKQITVRLTALLLALVMTTTLALAANKSGYSDVPDKH